jgi:periplasmic copper chaperone A
MRTLLTALALGLAACGAPAQTAAQPGRSAVTLRVEHAWAAPTPGGVDVSAGYLTIANGTAAEDRLLRAVSPRAARVELHEMTMEGDVMRMRAVDALAIPAGGSIELTPSGRHLMFFGVTQPFVEGEAIPLRLTFERAGELDVSLPVRRQTASHSGH